MGRISKNKSTIHAENSFIKFLIKQKYVLLIISVIYIAIYFFLTYLYPYPLATFDSFAYVKAALVNQEDGYRPLGYSTFLIWIHNFSTSISIVATIQFLLNALASVFFVFTIKYIFSSDNKYIDYILYFFSIFSIPILYLTDSLISDSLFTSLTLLWVAFGLWLIFSKKIYQSVIFFILHIIILISLINVRYTGLFYPFVTVIIVLLTLYRRNKLICFAMSIIPILVVYNIYSRQTQKTKERTGIETFSGFSGWQTANNALNVLPYIKLETSTIEDKELKEFAEFAVKYDSLIIPLIKPSAKFIFNNKLPLKQFLFFKMQQNKIAYAKEWTYLGKHVYAKFGNFIMLKYPFAFLRYYLVPNFLRVLYPTDDDLFNLSIKQCVPPNDLWEKWFHLNKEKMYSRSNIIQRMSIFFPVYRLIIWILVFLSILFYFIKRNKTKLSELQFKSFWVILIFVFSYFAFSVYAGPFTARYIAPILVLQITIIYVILITFFQKPQLKETINTETKKTSAAKSINKK